MHFNFKSTPTWTLRSRPQTSESKNPGPADYTVLKPLHHSGNVSAVTQARNLYRQFQSSPGPGAYNLGSFITDGQKRSMSARHFQSVKQSPGPHEYDNNTLKVKTKSPNFTISMRSKSYHQLTIDNNLYAPGPTNYNPKAPTQKKTKIFIGSSCRKDLTQTQRTPAPNKYFSEKADNCTSNQNPRPIIGSQMRKTTDFMKVQSTPGPGQYNNKTVFQDNFDKKVGFSCRKKTSYLLDFINKEIEKIPGPGRYQPTFKNKNMAPKIPGTARKTFLDDMQSYKKGFPGPGCHEPTMKLSKYRSASSFGFGKASRKPLYENEKTPAPVEYRNDKIEVMNSAPKFSVSKTVPKNQFLRANPENPGPGQYDPKIQLVKESSRNFEVGKETRPNLDKERARPGPGSYNLRGNGNGSGQGWSFKKQMRIAFTDHKNQAKDGRHYQIPQKVVDPPKYMKVSPKIKYKSPNKLPESAIYIRQKQCAQILI